MDVTELLRAVWRRRWAVLGVIVATTALAGLFAALRTERYESTAVLAITPSTEATGGLLSSSDLNTLMGTYAQTAKSSAVRSAAAVALGRPLQSDIDTSVKAGTGILRITASAGDPAVAADAAGAVAEAFDVSLEANRSIEVAVIDEPVPASSPADPRMALVLALGAGLGLFGGMVLALVVDRLRPRVVAVGDLGAITGAPLLGVIPAREARSPLGEADDLTTEAFRTLRTELSLRLGAGGHVVTVTGASAGAGSSSVAADLAVAFARVDVDTVLVDADLRHGAQHERFGLDGARGLASALAGEETKLQPTGQPNLRVLTAGPRPVGPTELLHAGAGAFLAGLRDAGALVVVDSPPLLDGNDARLLAATADHVIVVVRRGAATADVTSALELAAATPATVVGIVFDHQRR